MDDFNVGDPQDWFVLDEAIRADRRQFFVGRHPELKKAVNDLHKRRSSLVVFGERGIGKTSFAWQVLELLGQSSKQQKKLLSSRLPLKKKTVIWLECTRHMRSLADLISTLLSAPGTEEHTFARNYPGLFEEGGATDAIKRKYGFNVGIVKAEFEFGEKADSTSGAAREAAEKLSLSEDQMALSALTSVLQLCQKVRADPIVVILDEVDRLDRDVGLASLVKHGGDAQFVFVGVADDVGALLDDHESVGRKLDAVRVPGLTAGEVRQVFSRAVTAAGGALHVDPEFIAETVNHSGAFPWVVQQLGYHGCLAAIDEAQPDQTQLILDGPVFSKAVDSLVNSREGRRSDLVRRAIGDSKTKEQILAYVAQSKDGLTSEELRERVSGHLRPHVSDFLRKLLDEKVLRRRDSDHHYVFRDPVVRILVRLRLQLRGGLGL